MGVNSSHASKKQHIAYVKPHGAAGLWISCLLSDHLNANLVQKKKVSEEQTGTSSFKGDVSTIFFFCLKNYLILILTTPSECDEQCFT